MPKFLTPIDLGKLELRNAAIQNLGSAPSSPVEGQLYYDTAGHVLYFYNGTSWVSASGGTPADATTGSKGIVQLAGDLAGTAAAPVVDTGKITLAKLAAAIKPSGSAAAGDEAVRALGTGSGNAFPGNGRLDQLAAPTGSVALGSQKITGLADPTSAQDAATKAYVDGLAQGLDVKASVRVATTSAGTLGTSFANGQTVDGVTLVTGDRILIKNQAAPADNGIYVVASSGAPARATDFDAWAEIPGGFCFVEEGTTNADTGWVCTSNAGGTLGSTAVAFTQFSGAGSFTDGNALARTGNQLDWVPDGSTLEVSSDQARIKDLGVTAAKLANGAVDLAGAKITGTLGVGNGGTGQTTAKAARETGLGAPGYYSSATHSSGTTITITQATHGGRSSRGLIVQCQLEADGSVVYPDIAVASNGDVTVTFAASQSANSIRTTIIG